MSDLAIGLYPTYETEFTIGCSGSLVVVRKERDTMLKSTHDSWGSVTRTLHWISALLIIFGLTHGYWMANFLPRAERLPHYAFHSIVFIYFAILLLLRVVWRLSEPTPAQSAGSAAWERAAAHLGHFALYALMIAVLVIGYMNWSAFPARFDPTRAAQMDLSFLGAFKVPAIHDKLDRDVFRFWEGGHMYLSWALAALVVIHILAALRHQFVKHNGVMARMWSGRAA
jgi:cytochrome b561